MSESLPSGTVTLFFSDIEESSRLWDNHKSEMAVALSEHNRLLLDAISSNGGAVVKDKGDGFFAAFPAADNAVACALSAQRSLRAASWPEPIGTLRVRMALHTGTIESENGDYRGPVVNRVARLEGIAHGGQVLVSDATRAVVEDCLPEGASLLDLGAHMLRGMERSERVFQLNAPDLSEEFPPLLSAVGGVALPSYPTSFVGRSAEQREIGDLLDTGDRRLVTLLGPGGIGKTRLAVETARGIAESLAGGAFFVDLA
ncbi:MAG: adenylate/guanylate cyclase domain-containing protein, partial [Acidimicrobiia bacterium]